jgi:hypothetical protein
VNHDRRARPEELLTLTIGENNVSAAHNPGHITLLALAEDA